MAKRQGKSIEEVQSTLLSLSEHQELTKAQIEELTGLSTNTVYASLKACGLDTSAQSYTVRELLDRFIKGRQILEGGGTYEDVQAWGAMNAVDTENKSSEGFEDDEDKTLAIVQGLQSEVAEALDSVVKVTVSAVIPYLPQMMMRALSEEVGKGSIRKALQPFQQKLLQDMAFKSSLPLPSKLSKLPKIQERRIELVPEEVIEANAEGEGLNNSVGEEQ